jgi:hypothetical protein
MESMFRMLEFTKGGLSPERVRDVAVLHIFVVLIA